MDWQDSRIVIGLTSPLERGFLIRESCLSVFPRWDANGGQLYRVSTGPTLGIPAVQTASGRVLEADGGTPVAGALVYLILWDDDGEESGDQSAPLSAVIDEQGYWLVNLGVARTQEGGSYFVTDGDDRLRVTVWHPALERTTWNVQLRDLPAVLPLELRVAWLPYLLFETGQ